MMDFLFDDETKKSMTIKIIDKDTDTYVEKNIDPRTWSDAFIEFVYMLNGCGYIIDPVKAEDMIKEFARNQREEYFNNG